VFFFSLVGFVIEKKRRGEKRREEEKKKRREERRLGQQERRSKTSFRKYSAPQKLLLFYMYCTKRLMSIRREIAAPIFQFWEQRLDWSVGSLKCNKNSRNIPL